MSPEKLKEILQKGEGIEVEFKTSQFELNKDEFGEKFGGSSEKSSGTNTPHIAER